MKQPDSKQPIHIRYGTLDDVEVLSRMNRQLIVEEKHRNYMTMEQLVQRMKDFLNGDYTAAVFEQGGQIAGHAVFRKDPEWYYLRQFFVQPSHRRRGIGRAGMEWLMQNCWKDGPRVRVDVLAWNETGIAFWKAIGFEPYAVTLEKDVKPSRA